MRRPIWLSTWFEQDAARQMQWYLAEAGAAVALAFAEKLDATMERITKFPETGPEQKYPEPELVGLRFLPLNEPFGRFPVFYRVLDNGLSVERLIHGMRDLSRRLLDPPKAD